MSALLNVMKQLTEKSNNPNNANDDVLGNLAEDINYIKF